MIFAGKITIQMRYGYPYIQFQKADDYCVLIRLVRKKYKLRTKKKRIVTKYVRKFLNQALMEYIRNNDECKN